jgi:hypothetical protein
MLKAAHRWARVGEVLAVPLAILICLPLFAGWSPDVEIIRSTFTPERVQLLIVGIASIWWVILCVSLAATKTGRAYVQDSTGDALAELNISTRPENLTIAGLVFAGLAIGPAATVGKESPPLFASLASFVAAWGATFLPDRMSSTLVRDALHWVGIGCLVAAVYGMACDLAPSSLGPRVAILGAAAVASVYSILHARAHWRTAHPEPVPAPPESPKHRKAE